MKKQKRKNERELRECERQACARIHVLCRRQVVPHGNFASYLTVTSVLSNLLYSFFVVREVERIEFCHTHRYKRAIRQSNIMMRLQVLEREDKDLPKAQKTTMDAIAHSHSVKSFESINMSIQ